MVKQLCALIALASLNLSGVDCDRYRADALVDFPDAVSYVVIPGIIKGLLDIEDLKRVTLCKQVMDYDDYVPEIDHAERSKYSMRVDYKESIAALQRMHAEQLRALSAKHKAEIKAYACQRPARRYWDNQAGESFFLSESPGVITRAYPFKKEV